MPEVQRVVLQFLATVERYALTRMLEGASEIADRSGSKA
jgi:hypothetical protein